MAIPQPSNKDRAISQSTKNSKPRIVSSQPAHSGNHEEKESGGGDADEDGSKRRKRIVDIHGLSEYLGVCLNTIYSWVSQGMIPNMKLGRLLRFDLNKIDIWLTEQEREAKSEV